MKTRRVVVTPAELDKIAAGEPLPEGATHHLVRVLRLDAGASIEVGDGAGRLLLGALSSHPDGWRLETGAASIAEPEAAPETPQITLLLGLLKPKRWRWALEKVVELGAVRLVPVSCARSVIRLDPADSIRLVNRSRRVVESAGAQCRRVRLTEIESVVTLGDALETATKTNRLLAAPPSIAPPDRLGDWWRTLVPSGEATLLVGPEGGLTDAEVQLARDHGFQEMVLGDHVLRSETAVVASLAVLSHRLYDMM